MSEIRYCRDCEFNVRKAGAGRHDECRRGATSESLVSRSHTGFMPCRLMRESAGQCGPQAKLFREKRKRTWWEKLMGK